MQICWSGLHYLGLLSAGCHSHANDVLAAMKSVPAPSQKTTLTANWLTTPTQVLLAALQNVGDLTDQGNATPAMMSMVMHGLCYHWWLFSCDLYPWCYCVYVPVPFDRRNFAYSLKYLLILQWISGTSSNVGFLDVKFGVKCSASD